MLQIGLCFHCWQPQLTKCHRRISQRRSSAAGSFRTIGIRAGIGALATAVCIYGNTRMHQLLLTSWDVGLRTGVVGFALIESRRRCVAELADIGHYRDALFRRSTSIYTEPAPIDILAGACRRGRIAGCAERLVARTIAYSRQRILLQLTDVVIDQRIRTGETALLSPVDSGRKRAVH